MMRVEILVRGRCRFCGFTAELTLPETEVLGLGGWHAEAWWRGRLISVGWVDTASGLCCSEKCARELMKG